MGQVLAPACGAEITPPVGFAKQRVLRKEEHLRLAAPGSLISLSCQPKMAVAPSTLEDHANWELRQLIADRPSAKNGTKASLEVDGHPALTQELEGGPDGERAILFFTERARVFYTLEYASTAAAWNLHPEAATQLLASFRVLEAHADRGPTIWWHPRLQPDPRSLSAARSAFETKVHQGRQGEAFDGKPAPRPPPKTFQLVRVRGPVGRLSAYVTPDPKDAQRHPAVIWAHGGFGSIDSRFWEDAPRSNDQSARAFREAGIVLAAGSWRAENDNGGTYELFYGEVDDYLAVRDYVAKLPYVDPARIYLGGHSSGGTLVLLAAEKSDAFRAAFSLGGSPVFDDPQTYARFAPIPFDATNGEATRLRSSAYFFKSITRPTFYFEGRKLPAFGSAQWMAEQAAQSGVPFKAFLAMQADHFSLVAPLTELIAQKILADTGPTTNIDFSQAEIDALRVER